MKTQIPFRFGRVLFLLAAQCGAAHATTIFSHDGDGAVYLTNGMPPVNGTFSTQDLIVGGTSNADYSGIAFFQLPSLGAGGSISAATLTFTVVSSGTMPNANADIYGLGYLTSTPVLNKIWQTVSDTETRNGTTLGTNIGTDLPTKLVDNAVTAGTTMATNATTVLTGAVLVNYLNNLYSTQGAVAGNYVAFRVNPDATEAGTNTSNFRYGGSHQGAKAAKLDLTVVPEPSGILLTAFGATGLLLRRRRA